MKYIINPELIWLLLYAISSIIAKTNRAPEYKWDTLIDKSWFLIAFLVLMTFLLFWIPGVYKNWLLIRIWIVCLVMSHFTMEKLASAYSIQGPGIGMGYLAGMLFSFIFLIIGSVLIKIAAPHFS